MDLELAGKTALITGGSAGIGAAIAKAFVAEGANVVIVSRDADRLASAKAAIAAPDGRVETFIADLSDGAERERLAAAHAHVDILINNAGAIPGGDLLSVDMATWQTAWALKVMGTIHLSQLYLERMKAAEAGVILNVIGMAGRAPRYDYICGSAGNAALIAFTNALGSEAPQWGVRVLGINPAATRTDRIITMSKARAVSRFGDESRWEELLQGLPFGRMAEPAEIADLAVMLASPRGSYMSGTVVDADGGQQFR
jgi:3-oxoacyl-[acyl-carrier protein] reductase